METLLIAILGIAVNNPMHMVQRLLILLDQVRFFDDMYSKSFTERLHGRLKSRFENWLELQRNLWIITLSSCWTSKKKKSKQKGTKTLKVGLSWHKIPRDNIKCAWRALLTWHGLSKVPYETTSANKCDSRTLDQFTLILFPPEQYLATPKNLF